MESKIEIIIMLICGVLNYKEQAFERRGQILFARELLINLVFTDLKKEVLYTEAAKITIINIITIESTGKE